jgi:hypothetical protein
MTQNIQKKSDLNAENNPCDSEAGVPSAEFQKQESPNQTIQKA